MISCGVRDDPPGLAADCIAGAKSVLFGSAGSKSMQAGQPVEGDF